MYTGNLMKATEGSAGYDLISTMDAEILPRTRMLIPTGVRLNLKKSTFKIRLVFSIIELLNLRGYMVSIER